MGFIQIVFITAAVLIFSACQPEGAKRDIKLDSDQKKVSYAIGQQIGRGIKTQGVDVNVEVIAMSIQDVLEDKDSRLSPEEMRETMKTAQEKMMAEKMEQAQTNKKEGSGFLEENKEKEGVKVTDSGLQYMVIEEGEGKKPKETDRVKVHYVGTLIDGTEFDSSKKRDKPAEFALKGVIPGWTEGLQLMKEGAKYKFFVPSDLAYGPQGRPGIPPNSTLVFEVELLKVL